MSLKSSISTNRNFLDPAIHTPQNDPVLGLGITFISNFVPKYLSLFGLARKSMLFLPFNLGKN